jgi:hypothetical protein
MRDRLLVCIQSTQEYYDRHSVEAFCLLAGFFSVWAWTSSLAKPLWFDELPGLSASSIDLLGYSAFAARLPAFLGMLVFLVCLFVFVSRRLSPSYGVLAALLILCTPVTSFAWEARPYGVILGLTGLAMLLYQHRTEHRHLPSLMALVLVLCLPSVDALLWRAHRGSVPDC